MLTSALTLQPIFCGGGNLQFSAATPCTSILPQTLESLRDGVNRLKDLFVMGDVTKAEYKTRLERLKDLIVKKENDYEQLKESLDGCSPLTHAERLQLIDELKASWTAAIDVKERNRLMKLMIERIEYTRDGDEVDIRVKFR